MKYHFLTALLCLFASTIASAHGPLSGKELQPAFADLTLLRSLNIPILQAEEEIGVGYAVLTPVMQQRLSEAAHLFGKCGGFEALPEEIAFNSKALRSELQQLKDIVKKEKAIERLPLRQMSIPFSEDIARATEEVQPNNIKDTVTWLSNFPSRFNRGANANDHVIALKSRLDEMLKQKGLRYEIATIDHNSTPQKSLMVRLPGSERPDEIIVLGGHLDSTVGWSGGSRAPGADDNASGSASLIEALRIISAKGQPQRTVEFFWYAGEESGLLGSAEIAQTYQTQKKNVIGVLQLDMTMFPGSGELVIASIADFTSAWLREYLLQANDHYIKARIISDECGYACSDHASWYRKGFPTLMPFESSSNNMNKNIHTVKDVIDSRSSFTHAAAFAKIAVIFAMDLGNSYLRAPR